jgi:hypothetical protein
MNKIRKLIKIDRQIVIECNNIKCNYAIKRNESRLKLYINKKCPVCHSPLFNLNDYKNHRRILKLVKIINFLFSWITVFYPKSIKREEVEVNYKNNKININ